ncbi:hypothetical protein QZH41_004319 [Actinostola sp. cb2023]|nr:hypothetical protein QZH41_004319 [Actinostola sp. cb2023]
MADADACKSDDSASSPTAGIIIIGDEILKGHTKDANSYFLVKRFWSLGIKVCKISVVADVEEDIIHEVQTFSKKFTFVITTGGIGPTHDDVTILSIAKAFNENIIQNDKLVEIIAQIYNMKKSDLNEFHMKMAMLPLSAELVHSNNGKENPFPVVRVHNVYVFPGVPHFVEKDFVSIEHVFAQRTRAEFHLCKVFLSVDETQIAHVLEEVHETFKKTVQLGSYPEFFSQEYKVKLTLESQCEDHMKEACQFLLGYLPIGCIVKVEGLELENGYEVAREVPRVTSDVK